MDTINDDNLNKYSVYDSGKHNANGIGINHKSKLFMMKLSFMIFSVTVSTLLLKLLKKFLLTKEHPDTKNKTVIVDPI
tara:strand:- start:290 stop:523 length:234 start_codon:yes stop_codon:yes gene_type:complete